MFSLQKYLLLLARARPFTVIAFLLAHSYDPENMSYPTNMFYAPRNLLKREALRYDPEIQFLLKTIWNASDVDNSGGIDRIEYFEMHSRITCALIGRGAGDSMMRIFLAKEDWVADARGHKTLNKYVQDKKNTFLAFLFF